MAARDLRWQVVDGAAQPEQPALFDVPEREIGTGEFRGLEVRDLVAHHRRRGPTAPRLSNRFDPA